MITGLSYNGKTEDGLAKWDGVKNISIYYYFTGCTYEVYLLFLLDDAISFKLLRMYNGERLTVHIFLLYCKSSNKQRGACSRIFQFLQCL